MTSNFAKELCAITHAREQCAGGYLHFIRTDVSGVYVERGRRGAKSVRHYLLLATTRTAINSYQFSLFDIKLFGLVHYPFMMTVTTQGIALVFLLQRGFAKRNNFRHKCGLIRLKKGALHGSVPGTKAFASDTGTHLHLKLPLRSPDIFHLGLSLP